MRFNVGVHVGILNSQFDGDRLFGFHKYGPTAGLNWYYHINPQNELRFDIDYLNIGSNYNGESRPNSPFLDQNYTLLSINMQGASFFAGYTYRFKEVEEDFYSLSVTAGLRVSRAFVFNTFSHNSSTKEVSFERDNLSRTTVGPEFRASLYLSKSFALTALLYVSANDMILNEENLVRILRPFYYGLTADYALPRGKKKKKKRRRR